MIATQRKKSYIYIYIHNSCILYIYTYIHIYSININYSTSFRYGHIFCIENLLHFDLPVDLNIQISKAICIAFEREQHNFKNIKKVL